MAEPAGQAAIPRALDHGQGASASRQAGPEPGRRLLAAASVAVLLFLCLPIAIVVPMSFSSARSLEFPPPGFSLRWYTAFFGDARWLEALGTSLLVASLSSVAALLLGSLAAYGLARGSFRGRGLLEFNFLAPMVVPHIILAVAFYIVFARIGLLGTLPGLVLGHTVLCVPYVVLVMGVALKGFDVRLEQVAFSLGASWPVVFWRILRPSMLPSLLAAWIFAFITSFDEVTLTVFVAGTWETIPKRMFSELILEVNPVITAVATLLIGFSLVSMGAIAVLMHRAGLLAPAKR